MPTIAAAVFDLDRTIIPTSSARVFQAPMVEAGLADSSGGALAEVLYRIFELVGESSIMMQAARLAPRAASGWDVATTGRAAAAAADELAEQVQPYALELITDHLAAGRRTVLATTSPMHLVAPLAERIGIEHVVATRWAESDGRFTGSIDGRLVWGRGKLEAVREWARADGVDLSRSFAYSDSYFDTPLLAAVGHPVAVNPDPRLAAVAALKGWPVRHLDKPDGVSKIAGRELQELLRPLMRPELIPNARFEISGIENIPSSGGALVVANHRSYFDPTALAMVIARSGRNARFLGKKEVFDTPVLGALAKAAGGIRVDRGTGSDEPLEHAERALRAGEVVMLMPQGTIPRGPAFFDPELKGRWGAARLATATRVPVVPVGLWGTERVWPRSSRLPGLNLDDPPVVSITIGEPVPLECDDLDSDTKRIMAAIVDLLPPEARERREPTEQELRATYPPGYDGDPDKEIERRPGSDT
ncbi:MAG: HAD-IB family hydrolase [Acidimicrobiales bacterium]